MNDRAAAPSAGTARDRARPRHVFVSCGEASGDRWGAALVRALRAAAPELRITALAGGGTAATWP